MKNLKQTACLLSALMLTACCTACGENSAYSDYSAAYKKTSSVGSLNVLFDLTVDNGSETVQSSGNMKMNSNNEVYYEMELNGKQISQYVQNGSVHTFVDGTEQISSTDSKDKGPEKADPDGGEGQPNEKTDATAFNSEKFMEEFSGMLEAGKIKELGVLDPVPSKYIKDITASKNGGETSYTMTFPDEFLNVFLKTVTSEQTAVNGDYISFDELKDFQCIAKENSDGYISAIEYKGYTSVTVSGDLMESGEEEKFDLTIDLKMDIQNPGTAVEVVIPS